MFGLALVTACGRVNFAPLDDRGDAPGGDGSVTTELVVSTPVHVSTPASGWYASIASDSGIYAIAYNDFPAGNGQSHLLRLDPGGQVLTTTTASAASGNVHESALVWTGSEYIVAWSTGGVINAARFSATGTKLTPDTTVSVGGAGSEAPRGVFDGTNIVFAYTTTSPYSVRLRICDQMLAIDSDVEVTSHAALPASGVAFQPSEYGVAASELAGPAVFSRHTRSGVAIGTPLTLASFTDSDVAIAATTTGYAVAWVTNQTLHVTSIDATGATDDHTIGNGSQPVLVWQGERLGMAWVDPATKRIVFAELEASGALQSPVVNVSDAGNTAELPALVWDGTGYAIAWDAGLGGNGIYFARVSLVPL